MGQPMGVRLPPLASVHENKGRHHESTYIYRVAIFVTLAITIIYIRPLCRVWRRPANPQVARPDSCWNGHGQGRYRRTQQVYGYRLVDIGEGRAIGQLTPSRAKEMIKTERDTQLNRVSAVVPASVGRTAQASNIFTVQISSPVLPVPESMMLSLTQRGSHTVRRGAPQDSCNGT